MASIEVDVSALADVNVAPQLHEGATLTITSGTDQVTLRLDAMTAELIHAGFATALHKRCRPRLIA